jgi:phosphoadenosine phosphosulfate reductase
MRTDSTARAFAPADPLTLDPVDALRRALAEHQPNIALACSFSAEDIVVLHMMRQINPEARVFALDTGRLDPETYELAEQVQQRFGATIEWTFPRFEPLQELVRAKGMYSFRNSVEDRKECCFIRKVEPLRRALSGLTAWVTGMRREQAATRGGLQQFEVDHANGGIQKVNPIAGWGVAETWCYVAEHNLPYNRLYDRGYTQIGCQPCTTSVRPGEDPRAGRWRWELPEHKECGLHVHSQGSGI